MLHPKVSANEKHLGTHTHGGSTFSQRQAMMGQGSRARAEKGKGLRGKEDEWPCKWAEHWSLQDTRRSKLWVTGDREACGCRRNDGNRGR